MTEADRHARNSHVVELERQIAVLTAAIQQKNETILDGAAYARKVEAELAQAVAYVQVLEQHAADLRAALGQAAEYARTLEVRLFDLQEHLAQFQTRP
jgi:chromosome segregation ATPase